MIFEKSKLRFRRMFLLIAVCLSACLLITGCSNSGANDKPTDSTNAPADASAGAYADKPVGPVGESTLFIRLIGADSNQGEIQPAVLSFHGEGGYLIAPGIEIPADGVEHEVKIDSGYSVLIRVVSSPVFQDGTYYRTSSEDDPTINCWIDETPDGWELSKEVPAPDGIEVSSQSEKTCATIDLAKQKSAPLSVAGLSETIDKNLPNSEAMVEDLQRMSEQGDLDEYSAQMLERNKLKVAAYTTLRERLSAVTDDDIEALAKCYRDISSVYWAITAEEVPAFDK